MIQPLALETPKKDVSLATPTIGINDDNKPAEYVITTLSGKKVVVVPYTTPPITLRDDTNRAKVEDIKKGANTNVPTPKLE